jgi:hypothetical protein
MLQICSTAALPREPILNDVGLYISSLRYLEQGGRCAHADVEERVRREFEALAAGAHGGVECEARGRAGKATEDGVRQMPTQTRSQSTGMPVKSTMSAPTLPLHLRFSSTVTPSPTSMSTFVFTSTSTATHFDSSCCRFCPIIGTYTRIRTHAHAYARNLIHVGSGCRGRTSFHPCKATPSARPLSVEALRPRSRSRHRLLYL